MSLALPAFLKDLNVDEFINNIIDIILKEIKSDKLNIENFSNIIARVMELASTNKKLTGPQKKDIVLFVMEQVQDFITKNHIAEENQSFISTVLSPMSVSIIIETIIDIVQNRFTINQKHVSCIMGIAKTLCKK